MSSIANSIRRGLEQAVAYAEDRADRTKYRAHVPERVDVKAIRTKLGMSQLEFAANFGFSIYTVRHWEQGNRDPEGPARAYLHVIDREPRAVRRALHQAA